MPLLTLVAAAALALAPNSTPYSDGRPPLVFQRNATVTLQFAAQAEINQVCNAKFGAPPAGMKTNACDTGERIVVPNPCNFPDTDTYAHLLCHELGHANGWPPTHGDFAAPPTPVVTQEEDPKAASTSPARGPL